jgi:ligand-binding sensor domain-containing protein
LNVLYFTDKILSQSFEAQRPYYKNRPTLSSENITAIDFDGGNRAWIGTNNGIWVFGEDGNRFFENFTSENSPLLDNEIKGIAVNRKTGEVFAATKKGLISHRTEANLPSSNFTEAYAFPNPVKNDFAGKITITGLKTATNVKITDTSGVLTYETAALGGTATWDGLNYRGEKVLPGIYFVFCTDGKGEESFVTKIAVLR